MRKIICDKCGAVGGGKRDGLVPRVIAVYAGAKDGGRTIDLCGECRKAFAWLVDEWLMPGAEVEEAPGLADV